MALAAKTIISAQPGPQTAFLKTSADICIYGGAAGGGKSFGLILERLRYVSRVPGFTAVFFRRTTPQITNPGGLWDESLNFIRGSAAPRISAPRNGAGRAAARSSFRICSTLPGSMSSKAPRSL